MVIFQNSDDQASLVKHLNTSTRVEIIRGSGVDLSQYSHVPLPEGVPVVMLAARMLADKGVCEFVQAARILRARGNSARFCLVGSADPANPARISESELVKWASEGVVERWGEQSDMFRVLSAAHIVVLPSYREGLPKVLLEAAACGRPVVATDVPGCREAIERGVTGVLVPARNAIALANAIGDLISDPMRCQAMGNAGRALAESAFDVRFVVAAHMRIYQALIDKS